MKGILLIFMLLQPLMADLLPSFDPERGETLNIYIFRDNSDWQHTKKGFLALGIRIRKGFYIYGNTVGEGTGRPTSLQISIEGSDLFSSGVPRFLPPAIKEDFEGKSYNYYSDETVIFVPVSAGVAQESGITIKVILEALACDASACLPVIYTASHQLKDIPLPRHIGVSADIFSLVAESRPQSTRQVPEALQRVPDTVLKTADPETAFFREFISKLTPEPYLKSRRIGSMLAAILFGLLAGLVLNITPCVLPVIGIKILSIIQHAGDDKHRVRLHGLAFSAGIMLVFIILAALSAFAGWSWGQVFQHTWFLAAMILFLILMAFSLFGLYTIQVPAFFSRFDRPGYSGSFLKGMAATVLATPCSGPFLGGVLAWSMIRSPQVILVIFIAVGIGMALPYLLLSMNTSLLKYVPKSGPWLLHFERLMAFLLMGTAVYLANILPSAWTLPIMAMTLVLGLAAYIFGRTAVPGIALKRKIILHSLTILILVLGWKVSFGPLYHPVSLQSGPAQLEGWEKFSVPGFFEAIQEDQTIVIDFTADWCPNCKVLEAAVLDSVEVKQALGRYRPRLMVVDHTRPDPLLEDFRNALGSRSIPFLAVFPGREADKRKALYLRDMYSRETFVRLLRDTAAIDDMGAN